MTKNTESSLVRVFKRIINMRAWFDFDRVRGFSLYLLNGFKKLFVPQKHATGESFEAAVVRMQLTKEDLKLKETALWRLSMLMVILAGLFFTYTLYSLIKGHWLAVVVSVVVVMITLVLAFRYHFWYFQIKERKLGCTLAEWYKQGLRGKQS